MIKSILWKRVSPWAALAYVAWSNRELIQDAFGNLRSRLHARRYRREMIDRHRLEESAYFPAA